MEQVQSFITGNDRKIVYYMCFVVLVINIGSTMLPSINERTSAKKMKTFTNWVQIESSDVVFMQKKTKAFYLFV